MRKFAAALSVGASVALSAALAPSVPLPVAPASAATAAPAPLDVLSYNVAGPAKDGDLPAGYRWDDRRTKVVHMVVDHDPDVFGLQEVARTSTVDPMEWLGAKFAADHLGRYAHYKTDRFSSPKVIFWKRDRFERMAAGAELLTSRTATCNPSSFSWVVLRERVGGQEYLVANAHFPAGGKDCDAQRLAAADEVHRFLEPQFASRGIPVVLLGDLNTRPRACVESGDPAQAYAPLQRLMEATNAAHSYNLDPTVPLTNCLQTVRKNWPTGTNTTVKARIDHVLATKDLVATSTFRDTRATFTGPGGRVVTASDHYPVGATLALR